MYLTQAHYFLKDIQKTIHTTWGSEGVQLLSNLKEHRCWAGHARIHTNTRWHYACGWTAVCIAFREEAMLLPAETGQENRFVCLPSPTRLTPPSAGLQSKKRVSRGSGGHDRSLALFSQADLLLPVVEETASPANGTEVYPCNSSSEETCCYRRRDKEDWNCSAELQKQSINKIRYLQEPPV